MAPTVLLTLLWVLVGGATIYYVNWLYHGHARELAENLTTIQASEAMQDVLWRLQATVLEVAELADGHTQREVAEWETAFDTHLAEADRTTVTSEERTLVATIRTQFSDYRKCIHRRLDREATAPESERPTTRETARLAHEVAASCQRLLEIDKVLVARSTAQRSRMRAVFNLALLSLFLAGPAVGILYGMGIARRLHRSMTQISIHLQDAADGLEHEVGRVEIRPSNDLPELQQQVQLVSARIKQVVEELQQARRETLAADRLAAVGELAAGVAHELRNPLTGVKLLIQAATKRPADRPLSAQQLSAIQEQIIRMEKTIQGLLDYARPPEMHQVRHDLRDTLRRALNLVEGHARQVNVVVREDFCRRAGPGGRRSRTAASGVRQSVAQRHRSHARRRRTGRRCPGRRASRRAAAESRLATPAPGSPKTSWSGCLNPSSRARNAARVWAWRSAAVSCSSTGGS